MTTESTKACTCIGLHNKATHLHWCALAGKPMAEARPSFWERVSKCRYAGRAAKIAEWRRMRELSK